jgi:hypothetical protein
MLEQILFESEYKDLEYALKKLYIRNKKRQLNEGVLDFENNLELNELFDEAIFRLGAAKRALGFANKLQTPEERKKHKSRVISAMNRLRNFIRVIEEKMQRSV